MISWIVVAVIAGFWFRAEFTKNNEYKRGFVDGYDHAKQFAPHAFKDLP